MPGVIIAIVIAVVSLVGGGGVYASQSALPGDPLYGVKTAVEGVQLTLAGSDEARAQVRLDLLSRRVEEVRRSGEVGNLAAAVLAAEDYARQLAAIERYVVKAEASGRDVDQFAADLGEAVTSQRDQLTAVQGSFPDAAQAALARAVDAADQTLAFATSSYRAALGRPDSPQSAASGNGARDQSRRAPAGAAETPTVPLTSTAPLTPTVTPTISSTVFVSLTQTISDVEGLADDPYVSGQSYNGLLAKLQAAEDALERGEANVGLNVLNAFVNQLNAMGRSGHISVEDYEALYASYAGLVAALDGTLKPPVTVAPKPKRTAEPEATPEPTEQAGDRPGVRRGQQPATAPDSATPEPTRSNNGNGNGNENANGTGNGNGNASGHDKDKDSTQPGVAPAPVPNPAADQKVQNPRKPDKR